MIFIYFSCLIKLARSSRAILAMGGDRYLRCVSGHREVLSLASSNTDSQVCTSTNDLYQAESLSTVLTFLRVFFFPDLYLLWLGWEGVCLGGWSI